MIQQKGDVNSIGAVLCGYLSRPGHPARPVQRSPAPLVNGFFHGCQQLHYDDQNKSNIIPLSELWSPAELDVPLRGAQFAADRIAPIRSDLKSHDSNRNPELRSIHCDVFTLISNVFSVAPLQKCVGDFVV